MAQGGMMPMCEWSEHTNPNDGKKYYYNAKTEQSVWEKPKELEEFEKSQMQGMQQATSTSTSTTSVIPDKVQHNQPKQPSATKTDISAVSAKLAAPKTAEKPKVPQDKSRPVSSTPVTGTPWCVVWTGDGKVFFYNPTLKESKWERPPDLAGRPDVTEMLKSSEAAERIKNKAASSTISLGPTKKDDSSDSDRDSPPPAKKGKVEAQLVFMDELDKQNRTQQHQAVAPPPGEEVTFLGENKKPIDVGKEAAIEAEVRAARERQVIPLDTRMKQFRDLLQEKEISAFSTWEKELHKIVFDPRYLLLTSKERKQVFDKYVRERADEERREKKSKMKVKREAFKQLMEEKEVHGKSSFSEFHSKHGKDERFKGIEKNREREALFTEFLIECRKKEKEEREAKRKAAKKEFMALLKETEAIDRHSHWSEVKKTVDSDPRYKAVESSSQREDWFLDHVHDLKEVHRREKEKKRKEGGGKRSRSRSRSPKGKSKRSRSKSRSRSREKKSKKKDKRSSRSRSKERKEDKADKDKADKDKGSKSDKEEGEMSDDTEGDKRKSVDGEAAAARSKSHERSKESEDAEDTKRSSKDNEEEEEENDADKEKREREERAAASIRKREEEVQKELSGHLHARDKERQQHRHHEAISNFQALLTDLIRHPDYTWKEAKKVLKKDGRYDTVSTLDKSERERLFDDHIDMLISKKKENYWKLLGECKEIALDSSFKEIKKQIKDDPRYSKYSSSDRKCEKQFNEFLKDKMSKAKQAFRELLMETKKINDKSHSMVREDGKDGAHMAEIVELLNKDKRYNDLDCAADERTKILMQFLEDQERRGPPPPPTASEPGRRAVK